MQYSSPQRMHYLENVVYMAPKRNSLGGRANSLPTPAPLVNMHDLARLQGMHERAKGKKGGGGHHRGNIGNVLNRLSKKLSNEGKNDPCKEGNECLDVPITTNKKSSRKIFERRGSAMPASETTKHKSSRMGQKIFKRTFSSGGSDNLLQQAIANKDIDMLDKLLAHDRYMGEINYLQPPGVTVFHQACVFGDFRVVKLLVDKGK